MTPDSASQPCLKKAFYLASASIIGMATIGLGTPHALAQQQQAQTAARDDSKVEVLIVTAQRRAQSIQDVGIAMNAFSANDLRELGMDDVTQVALQSPNVDIKYAWGNSMPIFTIRGVGMNSFQASDTPSVGLFIDDIFQTSLVFMGPQLYDMERVEILRGPQGALFGRNTNGGAVSYLSRRPTDELEAFARADYGRFQRWEVEGAVSGPLTENLSARVSINSIQQEKGWMLNRATGNKVGEVDILAGRAQFLYEPREDFEILLKVFGSRDRSQPVAFGHIGFWNPGASTATPLADRFCPAFQAGGLDPNTCVDVLGFSDTDGKPFQGELTHRLDTPINDFAKLKNDIYGATLNIEKSFAGFTVTSLTSYQKADRFQPKESDANPALFVDLTFASKIEAWSQELRVQSNDDGPFQWIAGAVYADDSVAEDPPRILFLDDFLGLRARAVYDQDRTATAGYVQLDWDISERWHLSAGGRLIHEKMDFDSTVSFLFPPDFTEPGLVVATSPFEPLGLDGKLKTTDYAFRVALDFKPTEDVLFYASVARGFKGGGFNGGLVTNPTLYRPFDPEIVYAYEIGVKTQFWDGRAIFNAAGFIYNYKGLQAATPRPDPVTGAALNFLANLATADIAGLEAELQLTPNEYFDANLGIGYLDTKNTDPGVNFDGPFGNSPRELPNSPELSLNGVLGFNMPMDAGYRARLTTDISWVSDHYKEIVNNLEIGSQYLWNARVTLFAPGDKWSVAAFVQNITNEAYVADTLTDPINSGWGVFVYSQPRTWGLSATVNW